MSGFSTSSPSLLWLFTASSSPAGRPTRNTRSWAAQDAGAFSRRAGPRRRYQSHRRPGEKYARPNILPPWRRRGHADHQHQIWLRKTLERFHAGLGREEDINLIADLAKNMLGRTFCPLGDAAAMPTISIVEKFRHEFEDHLNGRPCPYEKKGALVGV